MTDSAPADVGSDNDYFRKFFEVLLEAVQSLCLYSIVIGYENQWHDQNCAVRPAPKLGASRKTIS